ncbi:hypothetical protein BD408DRAFT_51691 [Parasitella parasitica]|nr:hypothetical protein BD408DRAFT_51691 [Parasitella parasitica]
MYHLRSLVSSSCILFSQATSISDYGQCNMLKTGSMILFGRKKILLSKDFSNGEVQLVSLVNFFLNLRICLDEIVNDMRRGYMKIVCTAL